MADDSVSYTFCNERHMRLHEKVDLCIKGVKIRLSAMDLALDLKTKDIDRRLEGLNELRAEVTRDREQFVSRIAYDVKVDYYDTFVREARDTLVEMQTKYQTRVTAAGIMSVFSMLIAVLAVVLSWVIRR